MTRSTRIGLPSTVRDRSSTVRARSRDAVHSCRWCVKTLFWASLGALVWTHVAYPLVAQALARVRTRPVRKDAAWEPTVTVVVAAYNEETVIERRLENLLALDYPPEKLVIVVASDASSDSTNELVRAVAAREPRVSLLDCPRGGKVAAQDRAVRERDERDRRVLRRQRDLGARCAPAARREPGRSRRRLRLRPAAPRRGRGWKPRGALLALRDGAPHRRVAARLDHGGQRLDLRRAARAVRRGRPALGARPLLPVPDGAGRRPRGVRAAGPRVREADPVERDRVPPQGADVRALLGDRAARLDASPASRPAISWR